MPPNAFDIPAGPYMDSCNGCGVVDDVGLRCTHCSKTCGKRVLSEQSWTGNCDGTISNRDGALMCLPSNAANLPPGNFEGSCHGCSATETVLSCAGCLDSAGTSHPASVDVAGCTGGFGNEQGKLVCMDAEATERRRLSSFDAAVTAAEASLPHDEL